MDDSINKSIVVIFCPVNQPPYRVFTNRNNVGDLLICLAGPLEDYWHFPKRGTDPSSNWRVKRHPEHFGGLHPTPTPQIR